MCNIFQTDRQKNSYPAIYRYSNVRTKHRGNLLFPLVDFPETFEKDTGRVHRNRILPDVPWAGKHNGICCPAWFHFREGRWLKYSGFLKDYAYYWLKGGGDTHSYSFPVAHAIYQYCQITGNYQLLKELYPELFTKLFRVEEKNS